MRKLPDKSLKKIFAQFSCVHHKHTIFSEAFSPSPPRRITNVDKESSSWLLRSLSSYNADVYSGTTSLCLRYEKSLHHPNRETFFFSFQDFQFLVHSVFLYSRLLELSSTLSLSFYILYIFFRVHKDSLQ